MKIYLDDQRDTPEGWTRTYTAQETIDLLSTYEVEELSLDNDLGDEVTCGTGYQVMQWIEERVVEENYIPPKNIIFHTANPVARIKMEMVLYYINRYLNGY